MEARLDVVETRSDSDADATVAAVKDRVEVLEAQLGFRRSAGVNDGNGEDRKHDSSEVCNQSGTAGAKLLTITMTMTVKQKLKSNKVMSMRTSMKQKKK